MDLLISGKLALVTGSTAGIGFAIARRLAREGARVIINGRTDVRTEEAVAALLKEIPTAQVEGFAADLSTADGAQDLALRYPEVDILVNNLGVYTVQSFEEITDQDWLEIIEANFLSGVRLTRQYLPKMKKAGWGRIIFISSESAVNIPVEMIHYGVTKTMQIALARGLAETTAGTAVTVNSILPGPTRSEGVNTFVQQVAAEQKLSVAQVEEQFFKTIRPTSLLQRFETTDEVADLVAFIASELSAGTNGAALRVEGGLLRSIL